MGKKSRQQARLRGSGQKRRSGHRKAPANAQRATRKDRQRGMAELLALSEQRARIAQNMALACGEILGVLVETIYAQEEPEAQAQAIERMLAEADRLGGEAAAADFPTTDLDAPETPIVLRLLESARERTERRRIVEQAAAEQAAAEQNGGGE